MMVLTKIARAGGERPDHLIDVQEYKTCKRSLIDLFGCGAGFRLTFDFLLWKIRPLG